MENLSNIIRDQEILNVIYKTENTQESKFEVMLCYFWG